MNTFVIEFQTRFNTIIDGSFMYATLKAKYAANAIMRIHHDIIILWVIYCLYQIICATSQMG